MLITMTENCRVPSEANGFSIANGIRRIANEYGGVKTFRAYWPLVHPMALKHFATRSDLQESGVSVIDCPHNGRKDTADRMMLGKSLSILTTERANVFNSD